MLPLRVFTFSVPTLNFLRCLLDSPQWPDTASHTWQEAKLETLPTEFLCLLAPPNSDSIVIPIKILDKDDDDYDDDDDDDDGKLF